MDNLDEKRKKRKRRVPLGVHIKDAVEQRRKTPYSIIYDAIIFTVALVLARRHLFFGAHPFGIAMLSLLPSYVWVALAGAVVGAVSLGGAGYVYAIITLIVVFVRVVTSGGEKSEGDLFGEHLILRMAAALIGGFTAAIYEVLLGGFDWGTLLFGLTMTLTPPVTVFLCSGLFGAGITPKALLIDRKNVFDLAGKKEKDKYNIIFFQCAAAITVFFVGFALEPYSLIGISASYLFAGVITLITAKRFGALRAGAVGFFAILGVSAMNSVAFALAGLAAGVLFTVGISYALIGGGVAIVAWSVYSGGLMTLLEVLPEYMIVSIGGASFLKKLTTERTVREERDNERQAKDMVGTMALSYRSGYKGALPVLEEALTEVSTCVKKFAEDSAVMGKEDYKAVVSDAVLSYCKTCPGYRSCKVNNSAPYSELTEKIAEKLAASERVTAKDFDGVPSYCHMSNRMFEVINEQAARAAAERYKAYGSGSASVDLEMLSRLIGDALTLDERERAVNNALTEMATPVAKEYGPEESVIRVYGERRYHVILAGSDDDGTRIASPKFKEKLEGVLASRLGTPEYFRSGSCVLMEADITASYTVECASSGRGGRSEEISGDTVRIFESEDNRFFALLSDGMGTGKIAKDTSSFVGAFLSGLLSALPPSDSVLKLLSHIIRSRGIECSATVDLFCLDLLNAEASFLKSGAAPSYIKRRESIFRIRSETAPIGLMKKVDAERIRVGVEDGDYIIMLSDGVSQSTEDAPWLLELLSKPPKSTVGEYADFILAAAEKHSKSGDDMTVVVAKIKKL